MGGGGIVEGSTETGFGGSRFDKEVVGAVMVVVVMVVVVVVVEEDEEED